MKKIITSLAIIAAVAAIAIGGTTAFFSDTETSNGNTFTAGAVDLKLDSDCHYDGMVCEDGYWVEEQTGSSAYPELKGQPCVCSWGMDDFTGQPFFSYDDIKPGDWGENTMSFHISSNPVWACLTFDNIIDDDNTCTGPEKIAEGEGNCIEGDDAADGELDENMYITMWIDDGNGDENLACNNIQDSDEEVVLSNELLSQYKRGGQAVLPIASPDRETLRNDPIPAGDYCVGFAWKLPGKDTGNDVQTDRLGADLSFYVEQSRNNAKFTCFTDR